MIAMISSVTAVLGNSFGGRLLRGEGFGLEAFGEDHEDVPTGAELKPAQAHEHEGPRREEPGEAAPAEELLRLKTTMHCQGCATRIEQALGRLHGVDRVRADAGTGIIEIVHGQQIFEGQIRDVLGELGYTVERHATLHDDGEAADR